MNVMNEYIDTGDCAMRNASLDSLTRTDLILITYQLALYTTGLHFTDTLPYVEARIWE